MTAAERPPEKPYVFKARTNGDFWIVECNGARMTAPSWREAYIGAYDAAVWLAKDALRPGGLTTVATVEETKPTKSWWRFR